MKKKYEIKICLPTYKFVVFGSPSSKLPELSGVTKLDIEDTAEISSRNLSICLPPDLPVVA